MVKRLLLLLALITTSGGVFAQDTDQMFPGLTLPNPLEWLADMHRVVTGLGLHDGILRLGWALFAVGFIVCVTRLTYYGVSDLFPFFFRAVVATAVLSNTLPIQTALQNAWNGLYTTSSASTDATVEEFQTTARQVGLLITPIVATASMGSVLKSFGGAAARAATGGIRGFATAERAGQSGMGLLAKVVMYSFVPVFMVYAMMVFLSGMIILIGMLLVPLVGAFFILPGMGGFMQMWFSNIFNALVSIAILPLMMNAVLTIGMLGPLNTMRDAFQPVAQRYENALGALARPWENFNNVDPDLQEGWDQAESNDERMALILDDLYNDQHNLMTDIGDLAIGWLSSLVALVAGLIIALFLMRNIDRVLLGYLGGIATGLMPGLPMGGGGSRALSSNTSSSSSSNATPALAQAGGGGGGGNSSKPATAFVVNAGGGRSAMSGGGGQAVAAANSGALEARGPRAALEDKGA